MAKKHAGRILEETVVPMDELKKQKAADIPADESAGTAPGDNEAQEPEKKQNEADENHEKYLRLAADFDNYRKRVAREKEDLTKYANERLIKDILPIVDSLDRALDHASNAGDLDAFIKGLRMIDDQLRAVLARHGVERIETAGSGFDPNFHEAVMQVESAAHEDNTIVDEFETGYLLNGRLLRPSKVSVAKQKRENIEE